MLNLALSAIGAGVFIVAFTLSVALPLHVLSQDMVHAEEQVVLQPPRQSFAQEL